MSNSISTEDVKYIQQAVFRSPKYRPRQFIPCRSSLHQCLKVYEQRPICSQRLLQRRAAIPTRQLVGTADKFSPDSIFLFEVLASLRRGMPTHALLGLDGLGLVGVTAGTIWSATSLGGYRTCICKCENLHRNYSFDGFGSCSSFDIPLR